MKATKAWDVSFLNESGGAIRSRRVYASSQAEAKELVVGMIGSTLDATLNSTAYLVIQRAMPNAAIWEV
jgi:hypothetical protein